MTNRRRVTALLLCIGLVFALAVSSAFIAHEAGHDCTGNDCPVCRMIMVHTDLLRMAGMALLMLLALFFVLREQTVRRDRQRLCLSASGTLVSWKIRLND